jgi:hypothetical protein
MNFSFIGLLALWSFGAAVSAADFLDAPGPGYRNQAESLRDARSPVRLQQFLHEHPTYRHDFLDALPSTRLSPDERAQYQERLLQTLEQFRGIRIYENPLSLSLEIQKLSPTIPKLSTENPFDRPIHLFDIQ